MDNIYRNRLDAPEVQMQKAKALWDSSTSFRVRGKAFCILAYRFMNDNLGSSTDLYMRDLWMKENLPEDMTDKFNYRWVTSYLLAMAYVYYGLGRSEYSRKYLNTLVDCGEIEVMPTTVVNSVGACLALGRHNYALEIYSRALKSIEFTNEFQFCDIELASCLARLSFMLQNNLRDSKEFKPTLRILSSGKGLMFLKMKDYLSPVGGYISP